MTDTTEQALGLIKKLGGSALTVVAMIVILGFMAGSVVAQVTFFPPIDRVPAARQHRGDGDCAKERVSCSDR